MSQPTLAATFRITTNHEYSDGNRPVLVDADETAYRPTDYVLFNVLVTAGGDPRIQPIGNLFTAGELALSLLKYRPRDQEQADRERQVIADFLEQSPAYAERMRQALDDE